MNEQNVLRNYWVVYKEKKLTKPSSKKVLKKQGVHEIRSIRSLIVKTF